MRTLLLIATLTQFAIAFANEPAKENPTAASTAQKADATQANATLPTVVVYKTESCGCCLGWVRHMEQAGFRVEVRNEKNLNPIKQALGVTENLSSCHTAKIGRYFVEGHVPADDVKRLLAESPNAVGIAVPDMPIGSPGMEQGNYREPYDVLLVQRNGTTSVYASHGK